MHSVPTFKSGFKKLTLTHKSLILINDTSTDLGQISLEIYKYRSDLEVVLPPYNKIAASFPPGILLPSGCVCATFVDIAIKNKAMYKQTAKEEEANI